MSINKELLKQIALSEDEYEQICSLLNRVPSKLELGLFGALWSEHCGYKHTKLLLKTLPNTSPFVISKLGAENAGVIDLGDGLKIVMKVESHNHPSAIEPKEGAATGVGGIVRDIFAMGAFPIALLNSLRFGPQDLPRNKYLFNGVVEGISNYGNCLGIPDVAGEIEYEECYTKNPLVNAMCVGIIEKGSPLLSASSKNSGDVLLLVGAETGKDGIHGASGLASQSIEEGSDSRSAVQVGNPFLEKVLLESCLLAGKLPGIVGMQDLGAAGLTSAAIEVAEKSNMGIELHLDNVHLKERNMTPYEIMLSESQERMLIITEKHFAQNFIEFFNERDVHANIIGKFDDSQNVSIFFKKEEILNTPVKILTNAPAYKLDASKPAWLIKAQNYIDSKITLNNQYVFTSLLGSPNIASKKSVFEQYDHQVQLNTIIGPGKADSSVLRLKIDKKAIAVSIDCDSKKCYLDPEIGASLAVAEACRNLVCTGATPIALTDGLNLGNPEKSDVQYQIIKTVNGIKNACNELGVPVISGNVSLYNEANDMAIYPTPIIGALGYIENYENSITSGFKHYGDDIYIIGEVSLEEGQDYLAGSEYQKIFDKKLTGNPRLNLKKEKILQETILELINNNFLNSAHDSSTGGLSIAIAECCILGSKGAKIDLINNSRDTLFGENRSLIVVSANKTSKKLIAKICKNNKIGLMQIGKVCEQKLNINNDIEISVERMCSIFYT